MKINRIKISNFRLFKEKEFTLNPEFNLVVGVNGSGKTSFLNSISVAIAGWAHAYIKNKNNLRPIADDEIREIQLENRFDKAKSVEIKAYGDAVIVDRYGLKKQGHAVWSRKRYEDSEATFLSGEIDYGNGTFYNLNFNYLGRDILNYIERGLKYNLPLFAVYACDRLWLPKKEISLEESAKLKNSRFDPYKDCFHTAADHSAVGEWILKHELASIQQKVETPILISIKAAAKAALDKCSGLRFDFEASRVMIEFEDGSITPFEHLSDGQRTMLGLFCDLARRCAILNPHLAEKASSETEGIVLIDELDLHLHPKWQRRIIEDLRKTFPKIQFICTTHSPFLIQSLRSGDELIILEGNDEATGETETSKYTESSSKMSFPEVGNLGIEQIVSGIMGVDDPEVSTEYMRMYNCAKEYLAELDIADKSSEEHLEEFKKQLANKLAPFADNPAFQAVLEAERIIKLGS